MKKVWLWMCLLALVLPAASAVADGMGYVEGIEYQRIVPAVPTSVPPGKVQVTELFWYGCPHCYHFERFLNPWLKHKPANVVFRRVPATLNPSWRVHAAAFYTAQILGVVGKTHDPLFDAIHREGLPMNTPEELADFYAQYGVSKQKFLKIFHSYTVHAKLAEATRLIKRYGADSVPTIIIDGKYRTNATMAGDSYPTMLKVVDFLIAKETAAMHKSSTGKAASASH